MQTISKIIFHLSLYLTSMTCFSQSALTTSSAEANIQGYSIQWSLGEMCGIRTKSTGSNVVSEGFLQPGYQFIIGTKSVDLFQDINIYPNPAGNFLQIAVRTQQASFMDIGLSNIYGEVIYTLQNQPVSGNVLTTSLDLHALTPGIYILTLKQNDYSESFKIIKI